METLFLVAKYIFLGILIFLGATVFTKSVGKLVQIAQKKEQDDK